VQYLTIPWFERRLVYYYKDVRWFPGISCKMFRALRAEIIVNAVYERLVCVTYYIYNTVLKMLDKVFFVRIPDQYLLTFNYICPLVRPRCIDGRIYVILLCYFNSFTTRSSTCTKTLVVLYCSCVSKVYPPSWLCSCKINCGVVVRVCFSSVARVVCTYARRSAPIYPFHFAEFIFLVT